LVRMKVHAPPDSTAGCVCGRRGYCPLPAFTTERLLMAITVTNDHVTSIGTPRPAFSFQHPHVSWKALAPIALALVVALIPAPQGLAPHAWYFFAIFAGVILGLMLEPLPGGAIGLIGVTVVAVLSQFVLF